MPVSSAVMTLYTWICDSPAACYYALIASSLSVFIRAGRLCEAHTGAEKHADRSIMEPLSHAESTTVCVCCCFRSITKYKWTSVVIKQEQTDQVKLSQHETTFLFTWHCWFKPCQHFNLWKINTCTKISGQKIWFLHNNTKKLSAQTTINISNSYAAKSISHLLLFLTFWHFNAQKHNMFELSHTKSDPEMFRNVSCMHRVNRTDIQGKSSLISHV